MGKAFKKIPTYDEVMDDEPKKVPSFEEVMGEPIKKKDQIPSGPFKGIFQNVEYPSIAPSPSEKKYEPQKIEEYNKNFEDLTGHKEFSLSEPVKPKTLLGQESYEKRKESFERKKFEINSSREKEIVNVQNKVETGTVSHQQLSTLYNKPYGKNIVSQTVNKYSPEAGEFGLSDEAFGNEKKWERVAKDINIKNRPKGVEAQNQYFYNLDSELNQDIDNLQTTDLEVSGGTGGAAATATTLPVQKINTNSPEELGQLLDQIERADYISDKEGNREGVREKVVQKINEKLLYLSAQKEMHPEISMMGDKIKYALLNSNVAREKGEVVPKGGYGQQDEMNQRHFELGLNYIKDAKPNIYQNVVRGIEGKGRISDADFETLSNLGQQVYNQQVFTQSAADPNLIGAETNLDYKSYETKKSEYAKIIGERGKQAGGKNRREFTKEEIKKLGKDLPNQEIVNDLAEEEQILWYDAIPKSGWREAVAQGVMQPIGGIKSTLQVIGESPAETYLRSKRLDEGIGGQLVANDKGQYSAILPSDRSNIWYDMARGFGQFIPQVLLAKGLGGALGKAVSFETRAALTAAQRSNLEIYGGTIASTYAQTYGDAYSDALEKTGDPATANLIGNIDAISSAGFETILPDVKIADKALSGLKRTLSNDIVDLIKKGGDPATLAKQARPFIQKFVTNTLNISGQEVAEEVGTNVVDYITEAIFSPASAKDRDLGEEVIETAKGTFISMLLPSILGGGGASLNKDFTRDGLSASAINFSDSKNSLDKALLKNAITQDDYNKSLTLFGIHKNSIETAPKVNSNNETLTPEERMEYAYQNTLSQIYAENKAATDDTAEQEAIQKKIDIAEKEKNKIVGKEIIRTPEGIATPINQPDNEKTDILATELGAEPESAVVVTELKRTGMETTTEGGVTVIKPVSEPKSTSVIKPGENQAPRVVPLKKENETETEEVTEVSDETETTQPDNAAVIETQQPAETGNITEPPATPPVEDKVVTEEKKKGNKALANRLVNAKNVPQAAKEGIKAKGLTYEPKSQQEAQDLAKAIIDEDGIDNAVLKAQAQQFGGDVNTLVQTESLNRLAELSEKETDPAKRLEHDQKFAEIGIQLDEHLRKQGRGISAVNFFYKKSPLGVQMMENTRRKQEFEEWSKPKDKDWKEFFDEMMKEPEFEKLFKEQVKEGLKKERAEARKSRTKKVDDFFDKAKDQFKGGAAYSTIIPPQIITTALEGMKKAYHAGESVAKIIQDAIDFISDQLSDAPWDKEKFRKEWEDKLKEPTSRKPLTDEEVKARILEKFRKKLKGLSDKEKEEVVKKAFQKIVESGGLDYDDFKKIISDITGRGEMTNEEAQKLKELVKKINSVEDAAKKAQEERTPESLKRFKETQLEAGKASKDLSKMLNNKPNIIKRITSIMQLNTLGIPALVNNPIYNIINQIFVRFPVGVINSIIDYVVAGTAKVFNQQYNRETDVVMTQVEFFRKLGLGTKEAAKQFFTGLDRQDYIQKEIHGQQIRPWSSLKDLWDWSRGKKKLTGTQKVDKALQASPMGWIAEGIARTLNLGDKPQRFAAEGSQAAAFSNALGIKDIDYKLFIEFPREEAYRRFKEQGLSDAEAGKKADYVRDTIIKEGQRSTFQQDNMLNDILNRVFGGEQSGVGSFVKAVTVSPYIKIPANAYWSYYNLVNPEVALLQSLWYGVKAIKNRGTSDNTAAKQLHEARYWFAHAAVGMAMRAVVTAMVAAGIYRSSDDDDDTKKEREGERAYEQQGTVNMTKLFAWVRGEDTSKIKGGLVVGNRWLGQFGSVGNTIAKRYEEMTPEQKKNDEEYFDMILGNLELSSLKELEQGIFANTSSLLTALNRGGSGAQRWAVNTSNMLTNIVHPAAFAQISRAQLPYQTQAKADSFLGELKNSMLQRSSALRNITGQMPPARISVWGDKLNNNSDVALRLFGISKTNKDAFARPIYDDVIRTNDIGFFPPAVLPVLNDKKLNVEQLHKLEEYVGQSRKNYIAPFINDEATIEGFFVKYSELSDEDKKYVLSYLYGLGRTDGIAKFVDDYPEFKPEEKPVNYMQDIQRDLFKTLSKYNK